MQNRRDMPSYAWLVLRQAGGRVRRGMDAMQWTRRRRANRQRSECIALRGGRPPHPIPPQRRRISAAVWWLDGQNAGRGCADVRCSRLGQANGCSKQPPPLSGGPAAAEQAASTRLRLGHRCSAQRREQGGKQIEATHQGGRGSTEGRGETKRRACIRRGSPPC